MHLFAWWVWNAEPVTASLEENSLQACPWHSDIGYALATILLRLPGHAPMLRFNHILDVPLIVPHAKLTKDQVCPLPASIIVLVHTHCKQLVVLPLTQAFMCSMADMTEPIVNIPGVTQQQVTRCY